MSDIIQAWALLFWLRHLYAPVDKDKSLIPYKPFELIQYEIQSF